MIVNADRQPTFQRAKPRLRVRWIVPLMGRHTNSITHGTPSGYRRGCRCNFCDEANRAYNREYMEQRRMLRPDVRQYNREYQRKLRRLRRDAKTTDKTGG